MVILNIKHSENNQFLYETTLTVQVDELIEELVQLSNFRVKLDSTANSIEELVKYGPLKPEESRGLSPETPLLEPEKTEARTPKPLPGHRQVPDPNHYRIGWCVPEELGQKILETTKNAKDLVLKDQALVYKKLINRQELEEAFLLMKGAVMMAYPAYTGLPEWEPAMLFLEGRDDASMYPQDSVFESSKIALWFAGKEIKRGKKLNECVKTNERSKIVIKMNKAGTGCPVREPVVDKDTQQQMIAWYHKKQEEEKKMLVENEDDYLNSAWANPKGMKNALHGTQNISWKFH